MITLIVSFAITAIACLLVLVLGSLRWHVEKIPVEEIETVVNDFKNFAKVLREAVQ